jgi:hypothetical protein
VKLLSRVENRGLWPLLSRSDAGDGPRWAAARKFIRRETGCCNMTLNQNSAYTAFSFERFLSKQIKPDLVKAFFGIELPVNQRFAADRRIARNDSNKTYNHKN